MFIFTESEIYLNSKQICELYVGENEEGWILWATTGTDNNHRVVIVDEVKHRETIEKLIAAIATDNDETLIFDAIKWIQNEEKEAIPYTELCATTFNKNTKRAILRLPEVHGFTLQATPTEKDSHIFSLKDSLILIETIFEDSQDKAYWHDVVMPVISKSKMKLSISNDSSTYLLWSCPFFVGDSVFGGYISWHPFDAFTGNSKDIFNVYLKLQKAYNNGENIKLEIMRDEQNEMD